MKRLRPRAARPLRNTTIAVMLAAAALLAGCKSTPGPARATGGSTGPEAPGPTYVLRVWTVPTTVSWTGSYQIGKRGESSTGSTDGTGAKTIPLAETDHVNAVFQKKDPDGFLRLELLRDGVVVAMQETKATFGTVSIQH